MCGLIVLRGNVPMVVRGAAVRGAGARGPHSWGAAAWRPSSQTWGRVVGAGRLMRVPVAGDQMVVGHSRLATSTSSPGDAPDPAEGQPLVDGPLMVAHNGTLSAAEQKPWMTVPDSLSLLEGLRAGISPAERLTATRAPQAALWSDGRRLWAGRWDGGGVPAHPLWAIGWEDWLAVSSGYFPGAIMLASGEAHDLGELI
jgi:hypothetical protein